MKFLRRLGIIFDGAMEVMAYLAGSLLLCMMVLITVAVGLRYLFHRPIGWSIEISQYMLVFLGFLVIAWVLRREGHVKMDIIIHAFNQTTQALINSITSAVNTTASIILTFFAARVTWDLYQSDYFTPTILMVPKFIFIAVITLGLFTLSLQFIRRTYNSLKSWRSQQNK